MIEFEHYLERTKSNQIDTVIVGDTNFHLLLIANESKCQEYFDVMTSHNLLPQITTPTKLNKGSCKLYDHIFTRLDTGLNPNLLTVPYSYYLFQFLL